MGRRWVRVLALTVVVGAVMTSCSVPAEWAIRLNSDGTVDYLECYGGMESITVDYRQNYRDDDGRVEWEARESRAPVDEVRLAEPIDVAYYGELPPHWEGQKALRPPIGWEHVSVGAGTAAREDLVAGRWHWELNSTWPWIPEHPCDGWVIDRNGEPVRIS